MYDPSGDENEPRNEENLLHDPPSICIVQSRGYGRIQEWFDDSPWKMPWPLHPLAWHRQCFPSRDIDTGIAASIYFLSCVDGFIGTKSGIMPFRGTLGLIILVCIVSLSVSCSHFSQDKPLSCSKSQSR